MAPGYGDTSMASCCRSHGKLGISTKFLQNYRLLGAFIFTRYFLGGHRNSSSVNTLPLWFIEEHADEFEEWAILLTLSSSKPWRVRLRGSRKPRGNPQVAFVGGWKRFATENRLKEGDSLVFVLNVDARSEFQVYIFLGTRRSSCNSQAPNRKESNNSDGARISEEIEKGSHAGRQNLHSAGDGNMMKTGDLFIGKKKTVEERQQNRGDSSSGLESDYAQAPGPGYCVVQKRGAASEVFASQHGANSIPSFRRRLMAYKYKGAHDRMAGLVLSLSNVELCHDL